MSTHLVWFRSDLRARDNPALYAAAAEGHVTALFLLTPQQWRRHGLAAKKIAFQLRSIDTLIETLATLGIESRIICGNSFSNAAEHVVAVAQEIGAIKVFWNNEIALDEQRRDGTVEQALRAHGIEIERYEAATSMPVGSVRKPDGTPYSVFTPYKKRWISLRIEQGIHTLPIPNPQGSPVAVAKTPQTIDGISKNAGAEAWPAGEASALSSLDTFLDRAIEDYATHRDLPSISGTSKLSPHLAAGTVSANQCLLAAHERNQGRLFGGNGSIDTWISELIWREFYNHIMAENPRLAMGRAFKTETDALPWNRDAEQLERWQRGETGFPFVDAGMRQLNSTGWMHNRLRMVTAQFLAKHLFIDWRLGESYFMSQLVDGEFAANNGGWQWSASTGTDAVPYFRIFNPVRQAERFDPDGTFVRCMIPELAGADAKQTLEPWKFGGVGDYPKPIIDLSDARHRTLSIWKIAKKSG
jgi:deoxyribodipyrimidine photo-lyase